MGTKDPGPLLARCPSCDVAVDLGPRVFAGPHALGGGPTFQVCPKCWRVFRVEGKDTFNGGGGKAVGDFGPPPSHAVASTGPITASGEADGASSKARQSQRAV